MALATSLPWKYSCINYLGQLTNGEEVLHESLVDFDIFLEEEAEDNAVHLNRYYGSEL